MFWQSHPYSWPVIGWPSDLRAISKPDADNYFATYYAPNNLTAAIVGNFDPAEIKALARRYFGRIPRGPQDPPPGVTLEMPQLAEKRMNAECDCQPQVEVRYHTVPFRHADSYALDVLAELLNGRTGRLYKSLVVDKKIAASAGAGQDSRKWAGAFSFSAETKGDATPEQLEAAWYAELARLQEEEIPAAELEKVKNRIAASAFRRLKNPFWLMVQLLIYDGLGDWTYLRDGAEATLAVTAADVQRVAKQYFAKENRAVAIYTRLAGTSAQPVPEALAGLPEPAQKQIMQQLKQLLALTDVNQLRQIVGQMEQQKSQVPPPYQKAMDYLVEKVQQRIAELESAEGGE